MVGAVDLALRRPRTQDDGPGTLGSVVMTVALHLLDDPACRLTWAGPRVAERDSEHPGDLGELRDALQPEDFVGFRCVLIPRAPRSNQPDRVCLRQNLDEHIP